MNRYTALHYIGQYLPLSLLIAELALLYCSNFPLLHLVKPIEVKSGKGSQFHTENFPFLISHFTDTHINNYNSDYQTNFVKCLNASLLYQTDMFMHTGDVVDNFCADKKPKNGDQCSYDFDILNLVLPEYKKNYKHMIGNAGNHDMFGIYDFDSIKFNFLKTMKKFYDNSPKNYDEFLVNCIRLKVSNESFVNFVSLNPFRFPTIHPAFMYFSHTWRQFLDRLEEVLSEIKPKEKVIFYAHYPQSMFTSITNTKYSSVSSSGKTISELFSSVNVIAFISGHNHPTAPIFEHHNGKDGSYIESIGSDMKSHPVFQIVSIDNDRVSFHTIDADAPPKCIVTYPVPANQTAKHSFINSENAQLRILCFSKEKLKIDLHDDIPDEEITSITKVKENVYLYQYPLNSIIEDDEKIKSKKPILHHITIGGDFLGEIEFYSSGVIPFFFEKKNNNYSKILVIRFNLPIIIIFFVYITWPVRDSSLKNTEQTYFNFMQKPTNDSVKNWFLTLSGLSMKLKIQRLNKWLRISLFVAVILPLFIPISLIEIEGHYGFIWMYGIFIGGEFRYSEHGQDLAMYFYLFVILPALLACCCIGDDLPFSGAGGNEAILCMFVGFILVCKFIWFVFLFRSGPFCEFVSIFTAGVFLLFPFIIFIYYEAYKNRGNRNSEWYADGVTMTNSFIL